MFCSPLQKLIPSIAALLLTGHITAQSFEIAALDTDSLSWYIQMKYGLDQELFNGFQYHERYIQYKGNPYFPEDSFYKGSVTLKGKQYDDVQLKYDSYAQHLILEYTDFKDRYNQLLIDKIHTDSFRLGTHCFQKLSMSGEEPLFYQVFNSGPVTCYLHWKKDIKSISYNFQYTHEFTEPHRTYYFRYRGQIHHFTNRNSFISIFPDTMQREIKKYFKQKQLSFRKANPTDIHNMLNFVVSHEKTLSGL